MAHFIVLDDIQYCVQKWVTKITPVLFSLSETKGRHPLWAFFSPSQIQYFWYSHYVFVNNSEEENMPSVRDITTHSENTMNNKCMKRWWQNWVWNRSWIMQTHPVYTILAFPFHTDPLNPYQWGPITATHIWISWELYLSKKVLLLSTISLSIPPKL